MGLVAVMIWSFWFGGKLPRWVWFFIGADIVLSIPRVVEGYMKMFGNG